MPLKDFAPSATGLARNPLGIVALFIGFSEVMATLVLTTAQASLGQVEKVSFVAFLVVFPVVVFATFVWLVVKHHEKLYGPGDFRDDDAFLRLSIDGQKLKLLKDVEETEAVAASSPEPAEEQPSGPGAADAASGLGSAATPHSPEATPSTRAAINEPSPQTVNAVRWRAQTQHFLAEELVLRKLEAEWATPIQRSVVVPYPHNAGGVILDGIGVVGQERRVVEVKVARLLRRAIAIQAVERLIGAASSLASAGVPVRAVLGLVLFNGDPERMRNMLQTWVADRLHGLPFKVELRVFILRDLAAEFGMHLSDEDVARIYEAPRA
jgi:hypothetical protein